MSKDFLGRGWSFPVKVDNRTGKIALSEYEQDISESIWIILSTARGERVMRPDFGCGIHDYVFAGLNTTNLGLIEDAVKEALMRWERRIELIDISARAASNQPEKLEISIQYRVAATNNQYNLVYPFFLSEG